MSQDLAIRTHSKALRILALAIAVAGIIVTGLVEERMRWAAAAAAAFGLLGISALSWSRDRRRSIASALIGLGFAITAGQTSMMALFGVGAFLVCGPKGPLPGGRSRLVILIATIGSASVSAYAVCSWWASSARTITFYGVPEFATQSDFHQWLAIGLIASGNAVYEEVLWRYLFAQIWPYQTVLPLAVCFGLAHANSVPSGITGMILTFIFAYGMHQLTRFANGSLVPAIAAHAVGDATLLWLIFESMGA